MWIVQSILLAVSLCADCFAVTACSSVTLRDLSWKRILAVAVAFAVVQTGLLLIGWAFGDLFVGFIGKVAPVVGFLLLLYVGGSMILSVWKGDGETRDLDGLRNVLIGAVATSIDAFAVGISLSMDGNGPGDIAVKAAAVFVVTFLSVVLGMKGGSAVGKRYGHTAQLAGGVVLIAIGLDILLGII